MKPRAITRLAQLRADPKNRRKHTPRNLTMIADALKAVGAGRSIVVDEHGVVLAGNGVLEAAKQAGITKVRVGEADGSEIIAVRRSGLSRDAKRTLAMYDNRSGELSEWDIPQLEADLKAGFDLAPFFTSRELAAFIGPAAGTSGHTDPDDVPNERHTAIKRGDLFAMGAHRIMCGDSTDKAHVARLLGNVVPLLMVTDPPYGVDYDPAWRADRGINRNTRKLGKVTNDDRSDWREAWVLFPGDVAYVWHASLKASVVDASLTASGFVLRNQIVWAKDRLALSRGDYQWQHEPCWYAVRAGAKAHRTDDRTQTTLWNIPARDDSGHGHGTQKPVECMARAIRNHDNRAVYEPFAGSGTTIVACEQLARACYAIEIEPRYVQIAIDRWEAFTGKKAVKVSVSRPKAR